MVKPKNSQFKAFGTIFNNLAEANQFAPDTITVPNKLIEHPNHYVIPVFTCLETQRSFCGFLTGSINLIASRLRLKTTNHKAIEQIQNALIALEDMEVISGINGTELKPATVFDGKMTCCIASVLTNSCKNVRYATLYVTDLTSYKYVGPKYNCNMIAYLNQLAVLRLSMKSTVNRVMARSIERSMRSDLYHRCSYSILSEDNLYKYRPKYAPPVLDMLNIYTEAKVLAWARFKRTTPKTRKRVDLIAIINHGCENEERLRQAIELAPFKENGEIEITEIHC